MSGRAATAKPTGATGSGRQARHVLADAREPSDAALLAGVARGRSDAFTVLVRRYERRFYTIARRMLGRDADAEDAVQLAFLHVLTRADGYDATWKGSTWLYRVLTNVCIDAWRKRRLEEPEESSESVRAPSVTFGGRRVSATAAAERLDVQTALAKLPTEARVILLCCYVGGLSYREIARIRGISVNTVKTQLGRAKRLMRRHLEEEKA
ncbi:MAG: sigma-70 family RNA polymerase sigma factor [Deltaproteobacteria bacterium]|nr:sigma-70 family RNA polymerase sigma factor [Deltaproteobacteria bacterium]